MGQRVKVATFDAVGGPAMLMKAADGYWAGPTDKGVYRMARCGRHSSPSYPTWSTVRWGSEIKEEAGTVKVMHDGIWQDLAKVAPGLTKAQLMARNEQLYGSYIMPKTWLFNDFGHMTCYFFRDPNGNQKLDKDERMHLEYFHTTPDDEAANAAGMPISLSESHGCIHLKPLDIDAMIANGYFKSGNLVVVHGYEEKVPAWPDEATGTRPFEVHFFPGMRQVVVTGRRPSGPHK